MRKLVAQVLVVGLVLLFGRTAQADLTALGSATASDLGAGTISFDVDPTGNAADIADQLRAHLQLSNGANIQSITVENGVAHVEFAGAPAAATVEATLPTDVATAIGVGGGAGGALAGGAIGGTSGAALAGGAVLLTTGGVLGGLAASGEFSGKSKGQTTGTIGQ